MQFSKGLSTLCVIVAFCLCIDGSPLAMSRWEGNSAAYRQRPTWHYESTNWFTVQRIDTLGFYGLRDIAKDHYNWLKTQPGGTTYNGHCMVAVFWDPVTRTVFASSVPLGPRKGEMVAASLNNYAAPYGTIKSTHSSMLMWRHPQSMRRTELTTIMRRQRRTMAHILLDR